MNGPRQSQPPTMIDRVRKTCPVCDRAVADDADYETIKGGEGTHLCWGEWDRAQCETRAVDWRSRALRVERAAEMLVETLGFYGAPDTYFAIAFLGDPPCGEFLDDMEDLGNDGIRPGRRARATVNAVVKLFEEKGSDS